MPVTASLIETFEARAAQTPDTVALLEEHGHVSYHALNASANQLARYLRRNDLTATDRIGICADRSIEMCVMLLAVVKVGAAYVPIDPGLPAQSRRTLLTAAGARALVTHGAGDAGEGIKTFCLAQCR